MYFVLSRWIMSPQGQRRVDGEPTAARSADVIALDDVRNVPLPRAVAHTCPSCRPMYWPARSLT